MATDHHDHTRILHDGQPRGPATRRLLAGLGFVWLLRRALRAKRPEVLHPASADAPNPLPVAKKPLRGHEQRDANAAWIFGIVAFLFISGLCIHFILAGVLGALNRMPPPQDRWRPAQAARRASTPPGSFPVLQVSAPADLQAFRTREEAELHSYGWINATAGVVRVPIERAMELVLQQGLPVRTGTNALPVGPSPLQLIQQRIDRREPEIVGQK